jgi:hypothetical protein
LDLDTNSNDTSDEDLDNNYPLADFEILVYQRPCDDFPYVDNEGVSYWNIDYNYD